MTPTNKYSQHIQNNLPPQCKHAQSAL